MLEINNCIFENRSSTPPGRAVAFEEFKQTRGSHLNKIYLENKEITATRKKQFAELAKRINQAKAEIDETRIKAERKKNERLAMGTDLVLNSFVYLFIILKNR
jgi:kinesin family protein 6/9